MHQPSAGRLERSFYQEAAPEQDYGDKESVLEEKYICDEGREEQIQKGNTASRVDETVSDKGVGE